MAEQKGKKPKGNKKAHISTIVSAYAKYAKSSQKVALNSRIIENNRWFRQQYEEYTNAQEKKREKGQPSARSGYIFSAIANKHADAMDNYPDINILPREEADVAEAKKLTDILPCVMDLSAFKETYANAWWYKLKNGAACYGVFWNPLLNGGLGDIEIKKIDLLNLAWQPGITDLQESRYVFYSYYMDKEDFVERYGEGRLERAGNITEVESYDGHSTELTEECVLMVDCYYKTGGKVHMVKFTGDAELERTEGKEEYANGLYEHGMYPFVLDVMYPEENSPVGFGVIDVVKNPQAYIDKLDALIAENSAIVGRTRYFIKDNGGVNEEEFADLNNAFVHVTGSLDERNIKQIEGRALPAQVREVREGKIAELKEVIGNRDFQQGGTAGGVTSGSAITVLQQAGDKLSRDIIQSSYNAYRKIVNMCVELIRQFYDIERSFRITGENGSDQFVKYDNVGLKMQDLGGETGLEDGFNQFLRKPEFDVLLSVQKSNPFTKEQQNQTIMQLWSAGFFNPQAIDISLIAMEFMQFEGKDEMMTKMREMSQMQKQMQQMQQQLMKMQQQMQPQMPQVRGGLVAIPTDQMQRGMM